MTLTIRSFCDCWTMRVGWAVEAPIPLTLEDMQRDWQLASLPRPWERILRTDALVQYDGFAWYRCQVHVPEAWKGRELALQTGKIDACDETFFNGQRVGATGTMGGTAAHPQADAQRSYRVPADHVAPGQWNTLAIRVYDEQGRGGLYDGQMSLSCGGEMGRQEDRERGRQRDKEAIDLRGTWQLRVGDDAAWAERVDPVEIPAESSFR